MDGLGEILYENVMYLYERDAEGSWNEQALKVKDFVPALDDTVIGPAADIDGNTVIAALNNYYPQSYGMALVYEKNTAGNWIPASTITQDAACIGHADLIRISGDTVAFRTYISGIYNICIYSKKGDGNWSYDTSLATEADLILGGMDLDGDTLAVLRIKGSVSDVAVFRRNAVGVWRGPAQINSPIARPGGFRDGTSVSLSGDMLVVSQGFACVASVSPLTQADGICGVGETRLSSGMSLVLKRNDAGQWIYTDMFFPREAADEFDSPYFRITAISGSSILVGAPSQSHPLRLDWDNVGAAYFLDASDIDGDGLFQPSRY